MKTILDLHGGEIIVSNSGVRAEVLRVGGRLARRVGEFDEPLFRLRFLARRDASGVYPEIVSDRIFTADEISEFAETVESKKQ